MTVKHIHAHLDSAACNDRTLRAEGEILLNNVYNYGRNQKSIQITARIIRPMRNPLHSSGDES
jgi:hypothetical protein